MPDSPVPNPLRLNPRRTTLSLAPALTMIALVPETSIDPWVPVQSMVMALVMVTAPKPPGSRQSISPLGAVLEIAPAKVLQGAVRLHGWASSPVPKPRSGWPAQSAGSTAKAKATTTASRVNGSTVILIANPPLKGDNIENVRPPVGVRRCTSGLRIRQTIGGRSTQTSESEEHSSIEPKDSRAEWFDLFDFDSSAR